MDKKIKNIMDGAEPSELEGFESEMIPEENPLPDGITADGIAEKAKVKAGIKQGVPATMLKSPVKRKRGRMFVLIAAVLALVSVLAGSLAIALSRRSNEIGPTPTDTVALGNGEFNDGIIGGLSSNLVSKGDKETGDGWIGGIMDSIFGGASKGEAADEPSAAPGEKDYSDSEIPGKLEFETNGNIQHRPGILTASEWKDASLANISEWKKKLNDNNWYSLVKTHNIFAGNAIPVHVTSANGDAAIFNCKVELMSGGEVIFTGRTGIDGAAFLFYGIDGSKKVPDAVRIGDRVTKLESLDDTKALEISVDEKAGGVTALDLMLMVDTTGSMGDELEYLKAELADMVRRIGKNSENAMSIRVSVNFYRDEGDEYVVKYFDFRTDINECVRQIADQRADGGGDYPEAVHTALDNAVSGHKWRDEAVKLCFLVLDAPSHNGEQIDASLRKSLNIAAENGIRIIPVASSGVDTECEYLFRSFAAITGGTYIFLTNDSGIGGDHKDAEVGETNVEPLNECMIRVVCEYCGLEYKKPAAQNGNNQ